MNISIGVEIQKILANKGRCMSEFEPHLYQNSFCPIHIIKRRILITTNLES